MRSYRLILLLAILGFGAGAVIADESNIRFNQLGFVLAGPKRVVVKSDSSTPLKWSLVDSKGEARATGSTRVFGHNRGSNEQVHIVDFSSYVTAGTHLLQVGSENSRPFVIGNEIFGNLKYDALAYFYHNRSGIPIEAKYVHDVRWARPAGHAPEIVSCFDKKDQRGNRWPGCSYKLDATGGWYDAGDHGKYVVNAGISVWTLLNYYERAQFFSKNALSDFTDGKLSIPERDNGINDLLDEARWELKFMLGMQVPEGAKLQLLQTHSDEKVAPQFIEVDASGMAHHKIHGERWTRMPSAPHEDTRPRYAYPPSTTATLNLAAAAAQCARIWKAIDASFANLCLGAGRRAYDAAKRNPDLLPAVGFSGGGGYGDEDATDEFYWAAAELFITTGEDRYRTDLQSSPLFLAAPQANGAGEIAWAQVRTLGTISLAVVPNALPSKDIDTARAHLTNAAERYTQQADAEGYGIPYSSEQYKWGSNSDILNHAIVLGLSYDFTRKGIFRDRVIDALDYVLGRNPLDQSYVTGYGARPMRHPHHRYWAHQKNPAFPIAPPGALSGGPNSSNMNDPIAQQLEGKCWPQTCWADHVDAYALNEVAINWNAPLFWVAAFVDEEG